MEISDLPNSAQLIPEMPEKADFYEVSNPCYGDLSYEQHSTEEGLALRFESRILEGLIGYSPEEIIERIDDCYGTDLESMEFNNFEYGNGWAVLTKE